MKKWLFYNANRVSSILNIRKQLGDDYNDFINEVTFINIKRMNVVAAILITVFTGLTFLDYLYFQAGKWSISLGYKILFYSHCSSILLMAVILLFIYLRPVRQKDITSFHKYIENFSLYLFLFHMTFISIGDVFIDGTIAAYLGSIFSVATFIFTTNRVSLQLFLINMILMLCLLTFASITLEHSFSIQMINVFIYGFICLVLSRMVFYYQIRHYKNTKFILQQKDKLEQLAMTDPLTGALNRRSFLECANDEIDRSNRYGKPISITIFDIDFFKRVNDTFGHPAGDLVLVTISKLIKQNIRSTDLFVRWGGEEFIILYIETDETKSIKISEKLRMIIQSNKPDDAPCVTASFGVTSYKKDETIDIMIHRADEALYQAKSKGRNQVVSL
jgi:diguanylate cyclase (GGDEF)-like protein